MPRLAELALDQTALLFTVGLSLTTTLVFGLAPALHAAKGGVAAAMMSLGKGSGGRTGVRIRDVLVVARVAVSFVMLIVAGLLIRSLWQLQRVDPGFDPHGVFTAEIGLPAIGLYGVLAYSVTRRSRELAIRVALGARSTEVFRLVVRSGCGSWRSASRWVSPARSPPRAFVSGMLFGVASTDANVFVALTLALLACDRQVLVHRPAISIERFRTPDGNICRPSASVKPQGGVSCDPFAPISSCRTGVSLLTRPTTSTRLRPAVVGHTAARRGRPDAQVIADLEGLAAWRRQLRTLTRSRNLPPIVFRLAALAAAENQTLSARAEGYRSDCGCGLGGFVMTVAAVACVAWAAVIDTNGMRVASIAPLVGLLALAALVGKGAGLAVARWRLLRLAARIETRLRHDVLASVKG